MVIVDDALGIGIIVVGAVLLAVEIVHPGALLLIPGTILVVAGALYLILPNVLLDSPIGPIVILIAAVVATVAEIPFYRWMAPVHSPLSTTSGGLVGEEAIVIAPITVDTLRGKVRVKSEVWSARAAQPIPVGTRVRVVHGEGVSLTVAPIAEAPRASNAAGSGTTTTN